MTGIIESALIATGFKTAAPATYAGIKVTTLAMAAKIGAGVAGTVVVVLASKELIKRKKFKELTGEYKEPVTAMIENLKTIEGRIDSLKAASKKELKDLRKKAVALESDINDVINSQHKAMKEDKRLEERQKLRELAITIKQQESAEAAAT